MAEKTTTEATEEVGVEDVLPIRSRVSWGAIFAGAVMAVAVYLVFTLLGGAIGLTVSNNASAEAFTTGAGIWAVITTVISLLVGGWVTSQCAVGENKLEAVVHGVIMWGVVLFMTLWLVTAGMSTGFTAMWGLASFAGEADANWQAMARQAGVPQEQISEWEQEAAAAPGAARETAADPQTREQARDYAAAATWYTLLGTILSMAAAIIGAILGAGPTFRLMRDPLVGRRTTAMPS